MGKKTSYAINKIVKVSHRFVLITFRCVFLVYYIVMLVIVNIDVLFSHFVCVVFLSQDEEVPPAYCLRDKFLASNVINFASFRDKSRARKKAVVAKIGFRRVCEESSVTHEYKTHTHTYLILWWCLVCTWRREEKKNLISFLLFGASLACRVVLLLRERVVVMKYGE